MLKRERIIKDAVHGYISIPVDYFSYFIDKPHFQRLRRIEQTSMRSLYPSARHDRFVHSIGTYHLGCLAIESIKRNSDGIALKEEDIEAFKIACLLHDCGHAPFSHTFEKFFEKNTHPKDLLKKFTENKENFHEDLDGNVNAAPHEFLSAILAVTVFKDAIEHFSADPILVARMITGVVFLQSDYRNALIQLLNGRAIDVDKIDYTVRDIAVSGIKTHNVDLERLLSSMLIVNDNGYKLCFHHNALSAIKSVFEVKNFLYQWVFSHHTIQYDQYLLTKCVVDAAKNYTKEMDSDKALGILFNPNTYLQRSDLEEAKIAMLCDDDLVYLIKQFANEKLSHEWLYRQYSMIPLWKSYAEFTYIFERVSIECDKRMIERSLQNTLDANSFLVIMQSEKHLVIEHNALYIRMADGGIVPYGKIQHISTQSWSAQFYYVFINREMAARRNDIIAHLKETIH